MDDKPGFQVVGEALLAAGSSGLTAAEVSGRTGIGQSQVSRLLVKFEAASVIYSTSQRDGQPIWCIIAGTNVTKPPKPVRGAVDVRRRKRGGKKDKKATMGIAEAVWHRFLSQGSDGAIADEIIVWAKHSPRYSHINYTTITARCNALKYSGLIKEHPEGFTRLTRGERVAKVLVGVEGDFRALYREPPPKASLESVDTNPDQDQESPGPRKSVSKAVRDLLEKAQAWVGAAREGQNADDALTAFLDAAWAAYGEGERPGSLPSIPRSNGVAADAVLGG